MKNYFAPQIMSQLSWSYARYHITHPDVGFSFSLQPKKRILLSNNLNGLEKEQKSNFEEIMVNIL